MKTVFFIICSTVASMPLYSSDSQEPVMAQAVPENELFKSTNIDIEVISRMITPNNLFIELKGKFIPEILSRASFGIIQEPSYNSSHQVVGTLYLILHNKMYFLTDDTRSACLNRLHFQDHEKTYLVAPTAQDYNQNTLLKFPIQAFKSRLK
ncbi:hypothetical protein KBD08_00705 [Candidatus Babeliales bacterium]|nr:hypothetical protein [Candidatus Babeliales bacterium]